MKMLLLTALVSIFMMSTRSCKKQPLFDGVNCMGNCYVVKGKVIDSATNKGIGGVDLEFVYRLSRYTLFKNSVILVKTKTNSDGDYAITFDGSNYKNGREGYFSMYATCYPYFTSSWNNNEPALTLDLDSANFNKPVALNFAMFWPGYIKLHIKSGTATTEKSLSFTYNYSKSGMGYFIDMKPNLDTVLTLKTASGILTNLRWSTYPVKASSQNRDSILVDKDATVEYTITL